MIVVDNGSLAATIRARHPDLRIVEPGFNMGFAGGANRGTAVARGRWIGLINDDATVGADTLRLMIEAGERSPRIGSVAAQVRFSSTPDCVNSAGIAVDRRGVATERLAGAPIAAADAPADVFGATAACALYRRSMLDELGGLDERFFAYLEDVDLAWRARAAGWSCAYEPRAIAHHRGSATAGQPWVGGQVLPGRPQPGVAAGAQPDHPAAAPRAPGDPPLRPRVPRVAVTNRTLAPLRGRLSGLRTWSCSPARAGGGAACRRSITGCWSASLARSAPRLPRSRRRGLIAALDRALDGVRHTLCGGRVAVRV